MTDGEYMKTSEIRSRLQHASTAVTRAWIRDRGIKPAKVDLETRENEYLREDVEAAIESSAQRGPYRPRPSAQGPRDDDHGVSGSD